MTIDKETLAAMVADDEFGLLVAPVKPRPMTTEERLASSFDEISEFVREHAREPSGDSTDVAEYKLHARLEAMRGNDEQRAALAELDVLGLLKEPEPPSTLDEVVNDDVLGLLDGGDAPGIHNLRNVPKQPVEQPDRIAQRKPAEDFEAFEPLFARCHRELEAGLRTLIPFRDEQAIKVDEFYVLRGVLTYVAGEGERVKEKGRVNTRLRCVFENGTEADLLLRSFASQLYRFGKQVTEPDAATREVVEQQLGGEMGTVYVLRSLSEDPQVVAMPDLHKIGFTTQSIEQRVAGASKHATFLGAAVEEVASWEMTAGVARTVETLLHKFFAGARVDAWFERDGVAIADANEWFSVPLSAINEAIDLIQTNAIVNYEYDPDLGAVKLMGS